jgi:hypothetical protein
VDRRLADRSTDRGSNRLDHAHRRRLGLGWFDRFDNLGGGYRLSGLRLGLDLGGRWCGLLRSRLLDGGRRVCGTGIGTLGCHRSLAGSRLLRRGLLDRFGFFRLLRTGQTITSCATFEPIGLCLDQRAGVSLHTDTHCFAQRHHFGVGHSELLGELVHSHVFRQNQFSLSLASAGRRLFRRPISLSRW